MDRFESCLRLRKVESVFQYTQGAFSPATIRQVEGICTPFLASFLRPFCVPGRIEADADGDF
jgi:hypothetical protein